MKPELPSPAALRAEYEAGSCVQALVRKYAHCQFANFRIIYHKLKAADTTMRKKGAPAGTVMPHHRNRKLPVERIPELIAFVATHSRRAAGSVFGLTRQRVSQIVRSAR